MPKFLWLYKWSKRVPNWGRGHVIARTARSFFMLLWISKQSEASPPNQRLVSSRKGKNTIKSGNFLSVGIWEYSSGWCYFGKSKIGGGFSLRRLFRTVRSNWMIEESFGSPRKGGSEESLFWGGCFGLPGEQKWWWWVALDWGGCFGLFEATDDWGVFRQSSQGRVRRVWQSDAMTVYRRVVSCNSKQMGGYVYIICNLHHTTLYVGVTSMLGKRIWQHRTKFYPKSFSARYNCVKLVYFQFFPTILEAIAEEKRIKGGSREQKERLINSMNPEWMDLYEEVKFL